MEFLESFSKSMDIILMIIGLKGGIMVLDMCVKFGVLDDFGSPDTGSNRV